MALVKSEEKRYGKDNGQDCCTGEIKSIECVEYPELGMEAIWKIEVENFPAFILVDDKGNDFFKQLKPWNCTK